MVGGRSRLYKTAKESVMRSLAFAYRDRRLKKRSFRSLWIARISAATRNNGVTYSRFIDGLNKSDIRLNRKMLSELAIHNPEVIEQLIAISSKAVASAAPAAKKPAAKPAPEKAAAPEAVSEPEAKAETPAE